MNISEFIKKNNIQTGISVKFKNDTKPYIIKNFANGNQEKVYVYSPQTTNNIKVKNTKDIISVQNKPIKTFYDSKVKALVHDLLKI